MVQLLYYDNSDTGTKLLLGNLTNDAEHTVTFVFNRGGSEEYLEGLITSVGASASVGDASTCEVSFKFLGLLQTGKWQS